MSTNRERYVMRFPSIKSFTIENFKCIRDPVKINLKPITLLFGPNSAGKSTIIQALHYAWEVFERKNVDPDKTIAGGPSVDLGGFKNIVYNNDLTRPITLRFDLGLDPLDDPDQYFCPIYWPDGDITDFDDWIDPIFKVKNSYVKISVKWSNDYNKPIIDTYEVGINNKVLARIIYTGIDFDKGPPYTSIGLSFFDFYHPIFYDDSDHYKKKHPKGLWLWSGSNIVRRKVKKNINLKLLNQDTVLPNWGKVLEFGGLPFFKDIPDFDYNDFVSNQIVILISSLVAGPGDYLLSDLRKMRYIGPLRELPSRNYGTPLSPDESRWASGIAAWDVMLKADASFIEKTNDWLSNKNNLNSGYVAEIKEYWELEKESEKTKTLLDAHNSDDRAKVKEVLDSLPINKRIFLRDQRRNIIVNLQDVGIGISQVLPVIVGALDLESALMIIEQPELHIHPAFQVTLGDLFISQSNDKKIMFLLETHSEHLMLRLLRRIRETSENELPKDQFRLTVEQLAVYFVETDETGMNLTEIRVDKDGNFIDRWPHGFFGERIKEIF